MTTVATAVTSIRERLDELSPSQWSNVQLRRWLNEGVKDIARRTFHYEDVKTIPIVFPDVSNGIYIADASVIRINQVYFSPTADTTEKFPLQARAWEAMDNIWWNRQDLQSGYPVLWSTRGYSPQLQIKLFPVSSVAGTLYMNCVRMPVDLDITTGTGNVDCPDAWIEIAYFYCQYMARMKDRDWDAAKMAFEQYGSMIDNMIEHGDYSNTADEFTWSGGGYLPNWLTNPNWV